MTATPGTAADREPPPPPGERPRQWQTIAEWAGDVPDATDEFPDRSPADGASRREFLKRSAASLALAGLAGCEFHFRQPTEKIVPYVDPPEKLIPGRPLYFATATERSGLVLGLIAESHEGRPTKIEGNPDHPSSRGATDLFAQGEVLTLYDPDRSKGVVDRTKSGGLSTLEAFRESLAGRVRAARARKGAGLAVLTPAVTSPTLVRLLQGMLDDLPEARWCVWEGAATFAEEYGASLAFGRRVKPVYRLDRAEAVLALDADFLGVREFPVADAADFMNRRRVAGQEPGRYAMNRLYAVDCTPTLTGAKADHRLATTPEGVCAAAVAVARRLGIDVGRDGPEEPSPEWVEAAVADLRRAAAAGGAVVLAGPYQPAEMHALVQAINDRLGATGKSVVYIEPLVPVPKGSEQDAGPDDSLRRLVSAARKGEVETLVIVGGNPAYEAPPDTGFAEALAKVPNAVHLSLFEDETSRLCRWHVPRSHFLEAWGDARGHDGTATIVQPLIEPLYESLSDWELVALLAGRTESAHDLVRETWRDRLGEDVERGWHEFLRKGVLADTAAEPVSVSVAGDAGRRAAEALRKRRGSKGAVGLSLAFRLAPTVWDGRYANNGWLQELPNPLTKLTWGNAALVSVADAAREGIDDGDVVAVRRGDARVELPAYRVPGHPEGVVTLHLGYGRSGAGRVAAEAVGADVNPLRSVGSPWFAAGAGVAKVGGMVPLARTQVYFKTEGKPVARGGTLSELKEKPEEPEFVREKKHAGKLAEHDTSLYPDWKYPHAAWGMAIDLTTCTGCEACVIACQAENNIPVIGRTEVLRHRQMHWIRIDVYYEGVPDSPTHVRQQPVPCMHCELAPCEPVCPVAATVHDGSGLNEMIYNRCIGTRYCSNNCPYKVRRFNFLAYSDRFHSDPVLKLLPNPDVTVRSRGVMEKCNYCVQRIEEATIEAKREKRAVRDGEIVPACAQACPTTAIVFGDQNDQGSAVSKLKASPLNYAMLEELNTRPRTTYLAEVRNPREGESG